MDDLRFHIPNRSYWKDQIKCQAACPVHTNARGYVRAIAAGDYERAYLIARSPNPLASICGRVCGAPCELSCRRGDIDKPVAIRALKRFVCEQFGPETRESGGRDLINYLKAAAQKQSDRPCRDQEDLLASMQALLYEDLPLVQNKSVGIVGSGPAGLAAAHDLALLGFKVTVYEMESVLAGMLAVGIPEYRLPRDLIRAEIDAILALGVEAVLNCEVGKDISLRQLREQHDAVVVAVGCKCSRKLPIPGADAKGVIGGVEYLRDVSLGQAPQMGQRIVVIGGGNVAYDVGRTALRQISMDAARTALRDQSVHEVTLCSLESLDEMPADDIEIIEGDEEGVVRLNSLGPTEVLTDESGNVTGVVFQKCLRVFDEDHRFAPLFDENSKQTVPCDNVLMSVGQDVDIKFVTPEDGLDRTKRGYVACDPVTGRTNAEDVFIAGDLAYGPKLIIHAVASGKQVARAVYEAVTGRSITTQETELHLAAWDYKREKSYEHQGRVPLATTDPQQRCQSQAAEVEKAYEESQAQCEAGRCLDCGVNTIFDGEKCVLCGGCADICPEMCLRIVSVDRLEYEEGQANAIRHQLGDRSSEQVSAIIKDETRCIRCGLCAERCPPGAITMERFVATTSRGHELSVGQEQGGE
ncbi:MAG: FAD-dependent oxidoreductase [Planctomycetes bacterium]|nr:FAD-dependent oxidoreductase [Planctomycetota bacterium]